MIDMWYFVEKNGRAIAWSKSLFRMQCKMEKLVASGESPNELAVTDSLGRNHLAICR